MDPSKAYQIGRALKSAVRIYDSGESAFHAIELIQDKDPLFAKMFQSSVLNGTLCGKEIQASNWVEHLVLALTWIGEMASVYEVTWTRASELLLPSDRPTDARRVRETLIEFGVKPEADHLIQPCLPSAELPVAPQL